MNLSTLVLSLSSAFLLSSVSASVSAECRTGKKVVLDQFTSDTNEVFEKLADIKDCGERNTSVFSHMDYGSYKNCISRLNLPRSYENRIADLMVLHFSNEYEFRKAISSAADSACFDIKFEHFQGRDDITKKTYRINSMILPKKKNKDSNNESTKPYSSISVSSNSSSSSMFNSFGNIVILMLVGFIVVSLLIFGMVFLFAKWGKDNLPNKFVSEVHIKRDPISSNDSNPVQHIQQSNNSVVTIESYPVMQNDMPPPSYQDLRMDYPTSTVNNANSMPNPYSYSHDKKSF